MPDDLLILMHGDLWESIAKDELAFGLDRIHYRGSSDEAEFGF